jgi:hypothetical protein
MAGAVAPARKLAYPVTICDPAQDSAAIAQSAIPHTCHGGHARGVAGQLVLRAMSDFVMPIVFSGNSVESGK